MIQRNYEVGFNRAGRIMMQLQAAGIVGPRWEPSRATFFSTTCHRSRPNCRIWGYFN